MRGILDTHVFLWWITNDTHLPVKIYELITDNKNEFFLSSASCWEIVIKAKLDKLILPDKPDIYLAGQIALNNILTLPIHASHALNVFNLPDIHRDPFDRIIISQAQLESLPIITSDTLISEYGVEVIW